MVFFLSDQILLFLYYLLTNSFSRVTFMLPVKFIAEYFEPFLACINGLAPLISASVAEFSQPRLLRFNMPAVRTCFLYLSSTQTHKAFSISTKHLPCSVAATWQLDTWQQNFMSFFTFLYNYIDRRLAPTVVLKTLSQNYFLCSISKEFEPFHLKLAFFSFSLTYCNCQFLWELLNVIRFT